MKKLSKNQTGLRVRSDIRAGACETTDDGCPIGMRRNTVLKEICQPCLVANPVEATYPY